MFDQLSGLALGVVTFAIIIGVGTLVLVKFGPAIGSSANGSITTLINELGTDGLAGWTGAVVALFVGILFISMLGGKRKYR